MVAKRFLAVFLILVFALVFAVKNTDVFAVDADNAPMNPVWVNSTGDIDIRSGTFTDLFEQSKKYTVGIKVNGDGLGSGFVMTKDGYILTNAHVVGDKKKVKVFFTENKDFSAVVIGKPDTKQDVALLKIEEKVDLTPAPFGNSDLLRSGEWVFAIGNPFGLYQTVTVGVVSGLHRRGDNEGIQELIQTDAAINPGNSGGPLLNLKGEVIGMNVMMIEGNTTGFAIPIKDVLYSAREILNKGKVTYAILGISMIDLSLVTDEDTARKNELSWPLPKTSGVMVIGVAPDSPAFLAGFKKGDIILSFNGVDILDAVQFSRLVTRSPIGVSLPVIVERNSVKVELNAVLKERSMAVSKNGENGEEDGKSNSPGLNFGPAISIFPSPVRTAIQKNQGVVVEVSVDFSGDRVFRATNGFLVDEQHVLTVSSFVNSDVKYAFEANYFYNIKYSARLVYSDPKIGLSLFRLDKPYAGYMIPPRFTLDVKVGANYYSIVSKNPVSGNSTPYSVTLLNITGPLLVFPALLKQVGLGAPIFNQNGEIVGVWLMNDWDRSDPKDVPDVAYALNSSVIVKFLIIAKESLQSKE